jgi:hypothetical protein
MVIGAHIHPCISAIEFFIISNTFLQPLLKADTTKHQGRIIEFAFASLVNRACAKTLCQNSGLLTKYVKYFSDKYDG